MHWFCCLLLSMRNHRNLRLPVIFTFAMWILFFKLQFASLPVTECFHSVCWVKLCKSYQAFNPGVFEEVQINQEEAIWISIREIHCGTPFLWCSFMAQFFRILVIVGRYSQQYHPVHLNSRIYCRRCFFLFTHSPVPN